MRTNRFEGPLPCGARSNRTEGVELAGSGVAGPIASGAAQRI